MVILTAFVLPGAVLRDTMRVAKRVQHPLPTGNGMSVRLWSSEDLPADWPPTMTSWRLWCFGQLSHGKRFCKGSFINALVKVRYLRNRQLLAHAARLQPIDGVEQDPTALAVKGVAWKDVMPLFVQRVVLFVGARRVGYRVGGLRIAVL